MPEAASNSKTYEASLPDTEGKIEKTLLLHRTVTSVPPPNWEPLPHSVVFDEMGLPNTGVLKAHFHREGLLAEADVMELITRWALILREEANVLYVDDPVVVCGDIHGQFYDLMKMLSIGGEPGDHTYVFLGDYVDRGCFGMEVVLLLMAYKIRYPRSVIMLRGNHESRHLTAYFNFKREVKYKYSLRVYNAMMAAFDCLPLACIVNKSFLCVHGGLSPELKWISDIDAVHRFREPPSSGPMCDLLWSDPMDSQEVDPACSQLFIPNTTRGCSYVYSYAAVCSFLERNHLTTVIRGHEAQDEGYRLYRNTPTGFPSTICVFSAPNYCDTYDNRAAIILFERSLMNIRQYSSCSHPYYLPNFMDAFTWSLPFVAEKVLDIWANVLLLIEDDETTPAPAVASPETASVMSEAGNRIRIKIMAIGKLASMFRTLREERESIVELKGLVGGTLPQGVLQEGTSGIRGAIKGFQQSLAMDAMNERWPSKVDATNETEDNEPTTDM